MKRADYLGTTGTAGSHESRTNSSLPTCPTLMGNGTVMLRMQPFVTLQLTSEDRQDHLAAFEGKEVKSNSDSYIWLSEMTPSL